MKGALRALKWTLAAVIIFLAGWRLGMRRAAAPSPAETLPDYGTVQDFTLTDQTGRPFSLKDLKGHPWVADFIFTRCPGPCPMVSTKMSQLYADNASNKNLRFVSFSVDPDMDKPDVLAKYSMGYGAEPERWKFLTGDRDAVYRIVRDNFRLAVEPAPGQKGGAPDVIHSLHFVLVDGNGRILGYFNSQDDAAVARLKDLLRRVA